MKALRFITVLLLCLILIQCREALSPSVQQVNHTDLVHSFCKKLASHEATPLTEVELKQLAASLSHLSYDDTTLASRLLEPDPEEAIFTPDLILGEPRDNQPEFWEKPAELIAARLLKLAPVHTSRYIETSQLDSSIIDEIGFRCGMKFVVMFARDNPELAWRETLRHYKKYWNIFDEDSRSGIPSMATATFRGMWELDRELSKRYLLEENYLKSPYSDQLQQDALEGILISIEHDPEELEHFLAWFQDGGSSLTHRLRQYSFRIDVSPFGSVDHIALALLARIDPPRAIKWAKANDSLLLINWKYAVYAGWIKFWPYNQEAISSYTTRYEDAMQWLVDNTQHSSDYTLIHNAYCQWNNHDRHAAIQWLNNDQGDTKLKQIKTKLKKHPYIQEISQPR